VVRGVVNRFVTSFLGGGVGDVLRTQTPPAGTPGSIWEDRILKSAFVSFGGAPEAVLIDESKSVPAELLESLNSAVRPVDLARERARDATLC